MRILRKKKEEKEKRKNNHIKNFQYNFYKLYINISLNNNLFN